MTKRTKVLFVVGLALLIVIGAAVWVWAFDTHLTWSGHSGGSSSVVTGMVLVSDVQPYVLPKEAVNSWTGKKNKTVDKRISPSGDVVPSGAYTNQIVCYTDFSESSGGYVGDQRVVWGRVTISYCAQWRSGHYAILSANDVSDLEAHKVYGAHAPSVNKSCGVGSAWTWAWHCNNQGVWEAQTDSSACDAYHVCWDYMYRRAAFSWSACVGGPCTDRSSYANLTVRGNGEYVAGWKLK